MIKRFDRKTEASQFAVVAAENFALWTELVGANVIHTERGPGRITSVEQRLNYTPLISLAFEDGIKTWPPDSFKNGKTTFLVDDALAMRLESIQNAMAAGRRERELAAQEKERVLLQMRQTVQRDAEQKALIRTQAILRQAAADKRDALQKQEQQRAQEEQAHPERLRNHRAYIGSSEADGASHEPMSSLPPHGYLVCNSCESALSLEIGVQCLRCKWPICRCGTCRCGASIQLHPEHIHGS